MAVRLILAAAILLATPAARDAFAQQPPTINATEELAFDRPEAWALKYFIANTTLSGLGTPVVTRAGSVSIGFEGGWIPTLTEAQQRVGFNGTAPQDMNKAPVMLRPQVVVGLPGRFAITAAVNPPIKAFGVTPRLVSGALDWTATDTQALRVTLRGHGQTGTVTGAFTCSAAVAANPPGSAANPTGCEGESADEATLRYVGGEVRVALRVLTWNGITPHVAAGVNVVDAKYQLNAPAFGKIDRTLLTTSGVTPSTSAGIGYAVNDRIALAVDGYYAPMTVRRTATAAQTIDSLVNARALLIYRWRS